MPAPLLPRSTPTEQGVHPARLAAFVRALDERGAGPHSVMVVRHGYVVAEAWWAPYRPGHVGQLYSLSKTYVALAAGLAVGEGVLDLDRPLADLVPDAVPAGPRAARLRVRDVLSMVTGHAEDTLEQVGFRPPADVLRALLALEPEHDPGTHFIYHNGATVALAAAVVLTTGRSLVDTLRPGLFDPLGIGAAPWATASGMEHAFIGLHLDTESIAATGQLFLADGVHDGRRLLPEGWVAAVGVVGGPPHLVAVALRPVGSTHDAYRGDGAYGQYCLVLPDHDVVVALTSASTEMQGQLDTVWDTLLPAFADGPLDPDPDGTADLAALCRSRALPHPFGTPGPGGSFTVAAGEGTAEARLTLEPTDDGWTLTLDDGEPLVAPCGANRWPDADGPFVAAGGWTSPDVFEAHLVLRETPHSLLLRASGDASTIRWTTEPLGPREHLADLRAPGA